MTKISHKTKNCGHNLPYLREAKGKKKKKKSDGINLLRRLYCNTLAASAKCFQTFDINIMSKTFWKLKINLLINARKPFDNCLSFGHTITLNAHHKIRNY